MYYDYNARGYIATASAINMLYNLGLQQYEISLTAELVLNSTMQYTRGTGRQWMNVPTG